MAQAAADSGVATRPIEDIEAYRQKLMGFVTAKTSACCARYRP
ncbi:NADP-dependent malic enzyme [Bordetella pertussis]|nr:NADP-dependent malic enzyme [Bordetella pertussis]